MNCAGATSGVEIDVIEIHHCGSALEVLGAKE